GSERVRWSPGSLCGRAVVLALFWRLEACPRLCICYPSPMTVSCQSQNFTEVPAQIPHDSKRLFLQNNHIMELRSGEGLLGRETAVLWLYSNNISSIQVGAFSSLLELEELDLGDNKNLKSLAPDTFRGLEKLQSLHMHRCHLNSLPNRLFRRLYSLQYLYLQENNLHYLQDDLFIDLANLTYLYLHGNKIRTLSENAFRGLVNLDRLLLHQNRIHQVHHWAFGDLYRLTMLFLFNNSLTVLSGETMDDLVELQFLRLNGNPWACDCRARSLWGWFQRFRVSSSDLLCVSPEDKRGFDLRFLRESDFMGCPLPNPNRKKDKALANGRSNSLYEFGEGRPNPSSFYKGLQSKDLYSSKNDFSTEEDYWNNYEPEEESSSSSPDWKRGRGKCFGLDCPSEGSSPGLQPSLATWLLTL
uniref:Reticulon 4 receptor like 2 n=1 Tax=Latimeria chalumnae TaxID=7897 RepID=H3AD41_LATCH